MSFKAMVVAGIRVILNVKKLCSCGVLTTCCRRWCWIVAAMLRLFPRMENLRTVS